MTIKRFIEKVLNRIEKKYLFPRFAKKHSKKLKTKEFTVISNNCWGGVLYEYYGLQKQSPTIGSYFYAEDYVRFCKDLKGYLNKELTFINPTESRHFEDLHRKGQDNVIIGKLGDVEIVFLHYADKDIILEKWKRRIQRINWDKVILKFSYQNQCSDELIKEYEQIDDYKKIILVGEKITDSDDEIIYKRRNGKVTIDEVENFTKYIDVTKIINERL